MADFEIAAAVVKIHEGGFANNENDSGGATNWGISTPVYSAWLGRPATVDDVRMMPYSVAKKIYAQNYWAVIKGDSITSQDLATVFMDLSVLRGVNAATKAMQKVLGLKQDGIIGPVSMAAINATSVGMLMYGFQRECVAAFCRIVQAKPSQVEFLSNWTSRVLELNPVSRA